MPEKLKKEIFDFFKKGNLRFIKNSLFYSFLKVLIGFIQFWILAFFLGYPLSFMNLFAIFGVSLAGLETPISADLGSHELVTALAFDRLGMAKSIGATFAMIFRGANLIFALIGIIFFIEINFKIFQNYILEKVVKVSDLFKTISKKE